MEITIEKVMQAIRTVPDFPKSGIHFKDITTILKEPRLFSFIVEEIYTIYKNKGITKVVGIESRGFIAGSAVAVKLGAGFVPIRKPGKLPADVYSQSYSLEYGTDTLQIHKDAVTKDDIVLLHDDVLATGGSALAAYNLLNQCGCTSIYVNFLIELSFLNGCKKLPKGIDITALMKY